MTAIFWCFAIIHMTPKKANTTNVLHMEYSVVNGHILLTSININGVLL
jgi:hypothetical protein